MTKQLRLATPTPRPTQTPWPPSPSVSNARSAHPRTTIVIRKILNIRVEKRKMVEGHVGLLDSKDHFCLSFVQKKVTNTFHYLSTQQSRLAQSEKKQCQGLRHQNKGYIHIFYVKASILHQSFTAEAQSALVTSTTFLPNYSGSFKKGAVSSLTSRFCILGARSVRNGSNERHESQSQAHFAPTVTIPL